ncbi:MAG: anthranilate synthase component II [Alphaproteobacteria bacterium]
MFVLIDNYDSFTYNLFHYLAELGADIVVHRNDDKTVDEIIQLAPDGIIMSPGPCTPNEAGICLDLVAAAAGKIPMLGVCLGHQSMVQAFGGRIVRAPTLMHGKVSPVTNNGHGIFAGLPERFDATRYHSLIAERSSLPDCFEITAWTDDGIIMGVEHKQYEMHGVQFHPESIASECGHDLLRNFITRARTRNAA